jgi:hypothetical protein
MREIKGTLVEAGEAKASLEEGMGLEALSGVDERVGKHDVGVGSPWSCSSNTLLSICGGRDFFRNRRRSLWMGGLGGSSASVEEALDNVRLSAKFVAEEELRPVWVENKDSDGERGKGSVPLGALPRKNAGKAGTGGGGL